MEYREHIVRISYGKDSLKMLEVIKSRGLPLDRITTTDVWATDTISANLPPVEAFKERMDQRIWDMYRIEVEHLCAKNKDGSKKTYEQMFYHVPDRRSQNGVPNYRIQGSIKGFPGITGVNWCQKLKLVKDQRIPSPDIPLVQETQNRQVRNTFSSEHPVRRKDRNIIEYLGIAADEPKRFGQLNDRKRAPLAEFGIDEDLCGLYCQYNDMLSPSYETSCRDGCWFCHNQGVNQLRLLRRNYPDRWALLMKWDLDSSVTFKADGHTVHDFDERFRLEDEMLIDPDKPFRWSMLDGNLQKRLF